MTKLAAALAGVALGILCLRAIAAAPRADWPSQHAAARQLVRPEGPEPGVDLYDVLEMQRLVDRAGYRGFLGVYLPQPPAALLPYVPFARLPASVAKPAFAALSLAVFLATIAWLARRIGASAPAVAATLAAAGGSLTANLDGGQEMLLVAALLAASLAALHGERDLVAGAAAGAAVALKLFGLPWIALWALRGRVRPLVAAGVVGALLTLVPAAGLGSGLLRTYLVEVLPESLAGNFHDLFHPASQSIETILRRLLLPHPDWNPAPPLPAPAVYGFLSRAVPLSIVGAGIAAGWRVLPSDPAGALALQIPCLLVAAPTVTRYHLAALVPVILLRMARPPGGRTTSLLLAGSAIATWLPAGRSWPLQEPRVLGLLLVLGASLAARPPRGAAAGGVLVLALAAGLLFPVRRPGPPTEWQRMTLVPFAPLVARMPSRDGSALELRYLPGTDGTTFAWDGYARDRSLSGETVLEQLTEQGTSGVVHDDGRGNRRWLLALPDADVRRPRFAGQGILVDVVSGGTVQTLFLDPAAGSAGPPPAELLPGALPSGAIPPIDISPDGKLEVYAVRAGRHTEIRERDRATGAERLLVPAVAGSIEPRYSWDGKSLFFASDVGRCAGCTVVYRIARGDGAGHRLPVP